MSAKTLIQVSVTDTRFGLLSFYYKFDDREGDTNHIMPLVLRWHTIVDPRMLLFKFV